MPKDMTVSHLKAMAAAREEFMAYGFEHASMRRIGDRAGMTAAGLYRHCADKADLFGQLVSPAAEDLRAWMDRHALDCETLVPGKPEGLQNSCWGSMMRELVYPRMEEYRLLLTKSQGSGYDNILRELVSAGEEHMLKTMKSLKAQGLPVRDVTPKELQLLLSGYLAAIFEPVIRGYTLEEALRCLDTVEAFFMPGWKSLLGF